MTKLERLAHDLAQSEKTLAAEAQRKAKRQARYQAEVEKQRNKRRYHVGALADEHGLFAWENTTIAGLFALLATLRETPDPVAVLDSLLSEPGALPLPGEQNGAISISR